MKVNLLNISGSWRKTQSRKSSVNVFRPGCYSMYGQKSSGWNIRKYRNYKLGVKRKAESKKGINY